jgi:C-terminal processing protease CtpA/Prc
MVAGFASEYRLATLVGAKTAGRLVATSAFKVGFGHRLVLPVAAYYTWHGTNLEGYGGHTRCGVPFSTESLLNGGDDQLSRSIECLGHGVAA